MSDQGNLVTKEDSGKSLSMIHLFLRIGPFLRPYPRALVISALAVLIYTMTGRAIPMLFGVAIDQGLKRQSVEAVYAIAVILLLAELLRSLFAYLQRRLITRLGNQVLYDIRSRIITHIQSQPASLLDKMSSGRILTRITNDVQSLGEIFNRGVAEIAVSLIEMVTTLGALFWLSWPLAMMIVVLGVPMIWLVISLSRQIRRLVGDHKRKLAEINAFTAESIGGIKTIHLYDYARASVSRFANLSWTYRVLMIQTMRKMALLWPTIELFSVGTTAVALLGGSTLTSGLDLSAGQLASFVLLSTSFFRPLRVIFENYNFLQNSVVSAERVFQTLDLPTEDLGGQTLDSQRLRGEIDFRDVWFRYNPKAPWALRGIHLSIHAGERVALVGRTGSGKTSLINLVLKLYTAERGEVLIDGRPIKDLQAQNLRQRIAVIQQDPFLFKGTLADNVGLKSSDISRDRILWALNEAYCHELLGRGGLDFEIMERGSNLSLGEKQLIAFARALAFDPDVMILDEATANIDSHHEGLIQTATRKVTEGRTSLIIAHRLSTIVDCDRIVLLDQGQILEQGSHIELLKLGGAYFELCRAHLSSDVHNSRQPPLF